MIVEQVYPIVIDGRFKGVAGVDRALDDIEVTDFMPTGWIYVDDSTTITLADRSTLSGNSADPDTILNSGGQITYLDTFNTTDGSGAHTGRSGKITASAPYSGFHRYAIEAGFDSCWVETSYDGSFWDQVGTASTANGIFNGGDRSGPPPGRATRRDPRAAPRPRACRGRPIRGTRSRAGC